jgi:phosphatidylserine/phosphatidylglycerophosphate/cardiolipin synthase-like enzyme
MLIDNMEALVSTANFSRAGFSADRDFLTWVRNPRDVHELNALLRDDWDRVPAMIDAPDLVIAPASARAKLSALIRSARKRLDVYGEEMADPRVERLLSRVACHGVAVRVLLPAPPRRSSPVFRHSCVQIRVLTHPYIHAKILSVDGRRAFLGSENISTQSLDRNREIGLMLRGGGVRTLSATFERDWRRGLPVRSSES